jgi:hypothetical protein
VTFGKRVITRSKDGLLMGMESSMSEPQSQYIPLRKPGKLTLPEAYEKLKGQTIIERDLEDLTGLTEDEITAEDMRMTGHTEAAIEAFFQMYS